MDENCIFCKIVARQIPSEFLYESPDVVAFCDINPQAPVHILIIPKRHISDMHSVRSIKEDDKNLFGEILVAVKDLAKKNNLKNGYRVVANCGPDAGQTVNHLHFHLLGGRKFSWPPG